MAPRTKGLSNPAPSFSSSRLTIVKVDPNRLIRIFGHNTGEPYFNTSGRNRFDDPNPNPATRYGTCYFGYKLAVAIAETLLHDSTPVKGHFTVHPDRIAAGFVLRFQGRSLNLANMTGVALKRTGLHAGLSGTSYYSTPQKWSEAIYHHPSQVDGFIYMSRHLNTDKAVVLFDRAKLRIQMDTATPLPNYPGFAQAAKLLGIRGTAVK